jgi:hypothetical protein
VDFRLGCLRRANVGGLRREEEKCQRYDGEDFSLMPGPVSGEDNPARTT